jgi:putative ABC transport system permease protein
MRLGDMLRTLRFVAVNRTRAALTLLGIIIGSSAIVILASLLRGGEEALISTSQQAVDADLVRVRREDPPLDQRDKTQRDLSRTDAQDLAKSQALDGVTVGSENEHPTRATHMGKKKRVSLISAAPSGLALYRLSLEKGRFFADEDLAERRRVCVVGQEIWTELLERRSSLTDLQITIENQIWTVVGVLKNKPILGATTDTNIWNRRVLVPETTYDALFSPAHDASRIYVRRHHGPVMTPMDTLRGVIDATLLRRHFGVRNFKVLKDQTKGQEQLILGVVKVLLFSAGLIALMVGGINIMNIMLVTVSERTREIGLRRAVGATPRLILIQFLIESGTMALVGGLLGVALGALLSWLGSLALRAAIGAWAFHLEVWSIALGLGLSLITGVVFGLYPAWRAARLAPVDALRSE